MAVVILATRQEVDDTSGGTLTWWEVLTTLTMFAFAVALIGALASGKFIALTLCLPGVLLWVLPLTAAQLMYLRNRGKSRRKNTIVLQSRLRELTESGKVRKAPPGNGPVVWLVERGMVFNRAGNPDDFVPWKSIGGFEVKRRSNLRGAVYTIELIPKEPFKLPPRRIWLYYILSGLSVPVQLAICVSRIIATGFDVVAACTALASLFFALFYGRLVAGTVRQPRLRLLAESENLTREDLENTLRAFLDRSRSEGR